LPVDVVASRPVSPPKRRKLHLSMELFLAESEGLLSPHSPQTHTLNLLEAHPALPFGSNLILLPDDVVTSSTVSTPKRKKLHLSMKLFLAESEGFEPPNLLQLTVFKTAAFDHSASSPRQK